MKKVLLLLMISALLSVGTLAETSLTVPEDGALIPLHTEYQKWFLELDRTCYTHKQMEDVFWAVQNRQDKSAPLTTTFTWETDAAVSVFEIAENADFSDARRIETAENSVTLTNFKVDTAYFWRVNGGEARTFTTENALPRFLSVDGVTNVRDLGGYETASGMRVKQGMIYRGTAPDEGSKNDFAANLTGAGRETLLTELGVRAEIDLRGEVDCVVSPISPELHYLRVDGGSYGAFVSYKQKQAREIFEFLADEANYPVYIHCSGGADRTGSLCATLLVFLGVSDEEIITDYELTTISSVGNRCRHYDRVSDQNYFDYFWNRGFNRCPGSTIQEKVDYWLEFACKLSPETLEKVKANLLEAK